MPQRHCRLTGYFFRYCDDILRLSLSDSRRVGLGWRGLASCLWALFARFGVDDGPADGPGGRGFHGPGCSFLGRWDGLTLVRGLAAGR